MTKRISLLSIALSIALGMNTPCYGLYVMVRSGFGELKGEKIGNLEDYRNPDWNRPTNETFFHTFLHDYQCTSGAFKYKDHKNLSVALGGRFDVFDIGSLGLELEILGAYANFDQKQRGIVAYINNFPILYPEFIAIGCIVKLLNGQLLCLKPWRLFYLKNQRIAGAQINAYWEQYLLDWLSVGIGGGIGGAYVCTKFTTLDHMQVWINGAGGGWSWKESPVATSHKYVHSGSLLYNFTLFVRAEQFETLFEVGYRHIGLHQMFGARMYGYTIPKLANLHSDQVYIGVGRTF